MDLKYNTESQTVVRSTIVLCVSFALVYVVLFYVKWDIFKWWVDENIETNSWWLSVSEIGWEQDYLMKPLSWDTFEIVDENTTWEVILETWLEMWDDLDGLQISEIDTWISETVVGDSTSLTEMIVLSWTKTYYWSLDFVDLLWISYKYALKDEKWIYYLNMDGYTYDFSDIARKLWWNLYIMNTESEILANKMFGDKVTYINIPDYANKRVLMLLDVNNQSRLLAVDYSIYHQVKSYLQSLFIY